MKYSKRDIIETIILVLLGLFLVAIFVYFVSLSRERANDAKRIDDLRKIQSALTLYRHDTDTYPKSLVPGEALVYDDHIYLDIIPTPPPSSGNCPDVDHYSYSLKKNEDDRLIYNLEYCLGKETAGIPAGINIATPAGLRVK